MNSLYPTNNTINFDNDFNESITPQMVKFIKIPTSHTINFGKEFNKIIDGNLIEGIRRIILYNNFNQSVDNLPDSIEYLHLEGNSKIINLPSNLKQINLKAHYTYLFSFKIYNIFSKFKIVVE